MTEHELRFAACAQALAWLGKNEADGSFREILDVYNAGRPAGSYKMSYTDPWCAAFVSAVGMAAGLGSVLLPEVSCDRMIAAYKAAGRWMEADDYPAKPGDLIFYDWQDSGVGDNTGSADHVGIIVGDGDYYFTVVEGNYSDAVGMRTVSHNSRYIRGFAVPDYAAAVGKDPSTPADASAQDDSEKNGSNVPTPGVAVITDKPEGAVSAAEMQQSAAETQRDADELGEPPVIASDTCLIPLPILREGDVSEAVRNAQRLLIARGYYCGGTMSYNGHERPDGEFGPETAKAVKLFQSEKELTSDGVVGPMTWARLLGV